MGSNHLPEPRTSKFSPECGAGRCLVGWGEGSGRGEDLGVGAGGTSKGVKERDTKSSKTKF